MNAYENLVKAAIKQGKTVSVFDGGEWAVKRSQNTKEIFEAILSTEESELRFRDQDGKKCGWALVSAYGLNEDETVIDHTATEWMETALA